MIQTSHIRHGLRSWSKRSIAGALLFSFLFSFVFVLIPAVHGDTITYTRSFVSPTADGFIEAFGTSYSTAWGAFTGTTYQTTASMLGGQDNFGFGFYVARDFVYFDTSDIPEGANITSAELQLYVTEDSSGTDFNVTIQGTGIYPHYPIQDNDYYQGWYGSTSLGSRSTGDGLSASAYWNVSLNAAGLALLSTSGTSRFILRSSNDIAATQPSGAEYIYIAAREMGETFAPKLFVTYIVGGGGGGTPSNVYNYFFKGPYTDDGAVYDGTVSCSLYPTANTTIHFDLTGDGETADSVSYGLEQVATLLSWNISEGGNYTRTHYFTDELSETIYVFVPKGGLPFYLYAFQVNDFVGVNNGFLENLVYVDGANRVVERQPIDSINSAPFYMTWGYKYDMRIVCDQGVLNMGAFTALGESSQTLLIPIGAFPSAIEGLIVSVSAIRTNTTLIQASYLDTDEATYWIRSTITHTLTNGTDVTDFTETINNTGTYSLIWNEADPSTDYMVKIEAYRDGEIKTWDFAAANIFKNTHTNIWYFLNSLGDGLPIELQYVPAVVIVVSCLIAFSVWHISIGAWSSWIAAAFMFILGWLPYDAVTVPIAMGVAAVICAGVSIGEFKRGERTL